MLRSSLCITLTNIKDFVHLHQSEEQVGEETYGLIEGSQEVDLINKTICLGLQFSLIHVGSVHILGTEATKKS